MILYKVSFRMYKWIVLLIVFYNSSAFLPKRDYQAEFSWNYYKTISQGFNGNLVTAPYYIREMFACLGNVTGSSVTSVETKLTAEYRSALQLFDRTNGFIQMRYDSQRARLKDEQKLTVAKLAAIVGSEKLNGELEEAMDRCAIKTLQVTGTDATGIAQTIANVLKKGSSRMSLQFPSASDIDAGQVFSTFNRIRLETLWKYQFEEDRFTTCPFYANKTTKYMTDLMGVTANLKYQSFPELNLKAVELPFHNGSSLSALLIISTKGSLADIKRSLNHDRFRDIYGKLQRRKTTVIMPRFVLVGNQRNDPVLRAMGLKGPFSQPVLQLHEGSQSASVGNMMQRIKVFFRANGAEQAQRFLDRMVGNEFYAHESFLFVIFDQKELMPMLIGQVAEPPVSQKEPSDPLRCQNQPKWFPN